MIIVWVRERKTWGEGGKCRVHHHVYVGAKDAKEKGSHTKREGKKDARRDVLTTIKKQLGYHLEERRKENKDLFFLVMKGHLERKTT